VLAFEKRGVKERGSDAWILVTLFMLGNGRVCVRERHVCVRVGHL